MRQDRTIIFRTPFGAHLYGTDTPDSDHDFKGVALPTRREILLQNDFGTEDRGQKVSTGARNTADDVDFSVYSLLKFTRLLSQGQIMALDVLFAYPAAERRGETWPVFRRLWDNRARFLTRNTASFAGYCYQQAAKYGLMGSRCRAALDAAEILRGLINRYDDRTTLNQARPHGASMEEWLCSLGFDMEFCGVEERPTKEPAPPGRVHYQYLVRILDKRFPPNTRLGDVLRPIQKIADGYGDRVRQAERNEGVDWKALSHALRSCIEANELLRSGHITLPLPYQDRERVLAVKRGDMTIKDALDVVRDRMDDLEAAKSRSALPDEPDRAWLTDFVVDIHQHVVR